MCCIGLYKVALYPMLKLDINELQKEKFSILFLYIFQITGMISTSDEDTTSVHTMSSFKKVDNDEEMTTQSQRRPLMIGNANCANNDTDEELQRDKEEVADMSGDFSNLNRLAELEDCERKEKGTLETELRDGKEASGNITDNVSELHHTDSESGDEQKNELANMVDDLLELSKFESSGRRLTTDSGITSRGSSFSSEPDVNINDESIQEMKEYLHGKADALYQPFELGKMKDIKASDVEIVVVKGEKLANTTEKAEYSKSQIVSMVNLEKEKLDADRVNELDARVLAGMYLFDTGPSKTAEEYKHAIPALEILLRKEALENMADDEISKHQLEEIKKDYSVLETNKSISNVEYQTAEQINEDNLDENKAVEKLNAINIEKSSKAVLKLEETKYVTVKDASYIEGVEGEGVHAKSIDNYLKVSSKDENDSAKMDSLATDKSGEEIKLDIQDYLENKQQTVDDSAKDSTNINYDADTTAERPDINDNDGELRYSTDVDNQPQEKNDLALNGDVHVENSKSKHDIINADMMESNVITVDTQEMGDLENDVDNDSNGKTYETGHLDCTDDQATNNDITSDPNNETEEHINERGDNLENMKAYQLESFDNVMTNIADAESCDIMKFENDVNEKTKKREQNIDSLDHGMTDDIEGNLQDNEYLSPQEISEENTNECHHEYPDKNEPTIEDEYKGQYIEDSTNGISQETDRQKIDKESESNLNTKIESLEGDECAENDNEIQMGIADDVAYDPTPATNTDISEDSADNGEKDIKSTIDNAITGFDTDVNIDNNTSGKAGEILTDVGVHKHDRRIDLCCEGREIESHEIRDIEGIEEIIVSNDINQLEAVIDRNIERHATEEIKIVDESVLSPEKNVRKQLAELQKADVDILDKSQDILSLYSANENSDSGREFSKPIDDAASSLVKMDDTKPEVPNIINIQNELKQNELKTEDPSHTNELERKAMSLRAISDDAHNIASAKEINESDGIIIQNVGEFRITPSEDIVINEPTTPFDTKEGIAGSNKIEEDSERKEFTAEVEDEVFERMLTPETAQSENSVPDMSKFKQIEMKTSVEQQAHKQDMPDELIEEAIVPVLMKNEEKLPDIKDMNELEKKMSEEQLSKLNKDNVKPIATECNEKSEDLKTVTDPATRETINKDMDSSDELEPKVIVLLDDTTLQAIEEQTIELRWKIVGKYIVIS